MAAIRSRLIRPFAESRVRTPSARSVYRLATLPPRSSAPGSHDVVNAVEARLQLTPETRHNPPANGIVETKWLEDQIERLAHRDVLEVTDERLIERRIGNHAQAGIAHEQQQDGVDGCAVTKPTEMRWPSRSGSVCRTSSCVTGSGGIAADCAPAVASAGVAKTHASVTRNACREFTQSESRPGGKGRDSRAQPLTLRFQSDIT